MNTFHTATTNDNISILHGENEMIGKVQYYFHEERLNEAYITLEEL